MLDILTGGFLKGYRTYLLAALAFATVAVNYATGEINLSAFIEQGAMALGLASIRAGVAAVK